MSGLLEMVCRDHCVTKKMMVDHAMKAPIVMEARKDFIIRAHRDYQWAAPEIGRKLQLPTSTIDYYLNKYFGPDKAVDTSPVDSEAEQAVALASFTPKLGEVTAACQISWSGFDLVSEEACK